MIGLSFISGFTGFGFGLFEILFFVAFFAIIIVFIVFAVSGAAHWHKNNKSPRITVAAKIVSKREHVSHHMHTGNNYASQSSMMSIYYYATFEFESGDRLELAIPDSNIGLLAEGDCGKLTFQGTRFISFDRNIN